MASMSIPRFYWEHRQECELVPSIRFPPPYMQKCVTAGCTQEPIDARCGNADLERDLVIHPHGHGG